MTFDQLRDEVFGWHWQDETWHEVLRLVCGMIDERFVGQLVEWLMQQQIDVHDHLKGKRIKKEGLLNLLLAADCLSEMRNLTTLQTIMQSLRQQLYELATTEYPYRFDGETANLVLQAIIKIWDDRNALLKWLESLLQKDDPSFLPDTSVSVIVEVDREHCDRQAWLRDLVDQSINPFVRRAAVQELARGWKDDPDTLRILKSRAETDDDNTVRRAAMQELARGWKDDPDILRWLKSRAENDE